MGMISTSYWQVGDHLGRKIDPNFKLPIVLSNEIRAIQPLVSQSSVSSVSKHGYLFHAVILHKLRNKKAPFWWFSASPLVLRGHGRFGYKLMKNTNSDFIGGWGWRKGFHYFVTASQMLYLPAFCFGRLMGSDQVTIEIQKYFKDVLLECNGVIK